VELVDAAGEAGGRPSLMIFTELWGFESAEALRFWEEMTVVPTLRDSIRLVETYAGYEGESELLFGLYDRVKQSGRQLTNGELARSLLAMSMANATTTSCSPSGRRPAIPLHRCPSGWTRRHGRSCIGTAVRRLGACPGKEVLAQRSTTARRSYPSRRKHSGGCT
jgi:hypothetical protein